MGRDSPERYAPGTGTGRLPLTPGAAYISISSPKLTQTSKPDEGLYSKFDLTILEGNGKASTTDNHNQAYEPEGYLSVVPSATPTSIVAGAQLDIIFDELISAGNPFELRLVPLHHDPNLGLIQSVTINGDGTKTLKAYLTNPNGFVEVGTWAQGQSTYFDLQLALTSSNGNIAVVAPEDISSNFTVTANSYYVDMNSDPAPGLTPVILNEFY